jgi:hypothetical protein
MFGVVINVCFRRNVLRVDKVQHEFLHITNERGRLSASLDGDNVIRAPECEHRRPARVNWEVALPLRGDVEPQVSMVDVEQPAISASPRGLWARSANGQHSITKM